MFLLENIFFSSFCKNSRLTHFIIGAQKKTVLGPEKKAKFRNNPTIQLFYTHLLIGINTFEKQRFINLFLVIFIMLSAYFACNLTFRKSL